MGKEIKDYIHLYLGCEVMVESDNSDSYKDVIEAIVVEESVNLKKTSDYYFEGYNDFEIKLLLRPLSDMTDEEADITHGILNDYHTHEATRFLLSKHFDLFNLIPEGLAIDKTKHSNI